MSTDNANAITQGHEVDPRIVRAISGVVFLVVFMLPIIFTRAKFPADKVNNEIALTVLGYSIYVAVLCGLGVLIVELLHVAYSGRPLGWKNGHAFSGYICLTVFPVVYATFEVSEEAVRLSCMSATQASETIKHVIRKLEYMAPMVVVVYLLADGIGYKWSTEHAMFAHLLVADSVVLFLHFAVIAAIAFPSRVPVLGGFSNEAILSFLSGVIGISLIGQNAFFAYITMRR